MIQYKLSYIHLLKNKVIYGDLGDLPTRWCQ